jgi:transcriptional regulator with XRE-family HTH domain
MILSPTQIRSARALMNWSQKHLSELTGLAQPTIMASEQDNGENKRNMNERTIRRIYDAFEPHVEFLPDDGIKRKRQTVRDYKGREGFLEFIWDVHNTVKDQGGLVCVSNVDESDFEYWLGDEDAKYTEAMSHIKDVMFNILIKHGDTNFSAGSYAEYRWVKEEHFSSAPFYVYGNKLAMILFKDDVRVYVIDNKDIADAQRAQFLLTWESADIPFIKGKTNA